MMENLPAIGAVPKVCVALLVLLFFGLSVAITVTRLRTKTLYGVPGGPDSRLTKLVRAHGNTAEYVGLLCVLILWLGASPQPAWVVGMMVLAVAGRLLFALAMVTGPSLTAFNPIRALGVCATYVAGFGLGIAMLLS